jgi:hypothetical protein
MLEIKEKFQDYKNKVKEQFKKENIKKNAKNCISDSYIYLGLFTYWFGYNSNLALNSIIWPAQVEVIVAPNTRDLLNGIIGIPR